MASGAPAWLDIAPYDFGLALGLERELGISHELAQVLVRRGLGEIKAARAFLAADDGHSPWDFEGMPDAVALVLDHVGRGTRITVHGDYDVDGVCSTAILVRCLRRLGADVDWFLPSRLDDGYGLSDATVRTLVGRGTRLLVTVDCAITAVEEVASAREAGLDVLVTDHHQPRADGRLPDAPMVHPLVAGYPCPDLCATAVAAKVSEALGEQAGRVWSPDEADADLVALATIADCVPLRGENRRLVRAGLVALASTRKPGLRALMRIAGVDPSECDARAVGFRLAPRINAAGRLHRADAGLELVLTEDEGRAREVAEELDAANAERRDVETRILFEAEAQARETGEDVAALVLAGDGWHPGVIGIVASRIAERHHRPTVMIALDGDTGIGSGRSIPAFDLLAGLTACAGELERHGGHRAAAGLEIRRERVDAFRAAFQAHGATVLDSEDLVATERVDAIVGGDAVGLALVEELERLEPFGIGNPAVSLLLPAATFAEAATMGEGKHVRFTVQGGGARSRAVAFGSPRLPVPEGQPADAVFALERNAYKGAVEPRLVLREAVPASAEPPRIVGEPAGFLDAVFAELDAPLDYQPPPGDRGREIVDRRGQGIAGTIGDLVGSGESLLVVCADAGRRARSLAGRLGGFDVCSYAALERDPSLRQGRVHLVGLDPPSHRAGRLLLAGVGEREGYAHMAWGEPELAFARAISDFEYGLRGPLTDLYRALRDCGGARGVELEALLATGECAPAPARAGRMLRVLAELQLVSVDLDVRAVAVHLARRTALQRSVAYRAYESRRLEGETLLATRSRMAA